MHRRCVLLGGCAASLQILGIVNIAVPAFFVRHDPTLGCLLSQKEAEQYLPRTDHRRIISQSGDRDFDYALAHTLMRLSDLFKIHPAFMYYDDYDGKNAFATSYPLSYGTDGTVLFGYGLLKSLLSYSDNPDLMIACICAHECGHILQYKRGLDDILLQGQVTVKRIELQADFLAGYYAGIRKWQNKALPAAVFAVTQFNAGDNMISHPQHHGTPDERAAAISYGFELGYGQHDSVEDVISESTAYVTSLFNSPDAP